MAKLAGWNSLSETIDVSPADIFTAIFTGRPELLKDRELTKDEQLYVLQALRVLIDTNKQLQAHSKELSEKVVNVLNNVNGLQKSLCSLYDFANFKANDDDVEE